MATPLGPHERPTTVEAAFKVVEDIRFSRGNLDDEDVAELQKTSRGWQDKHRRNAERQRGVYARYTKMVANQLYSSKFRCIPELLQNADDAEYSSVSIACLTFRVRPTELIVDSTEDGFTRANVEAICATGESSKADDVGTTGEKGFGFKSIFGIAHKVHIQSGLWSFRFEHRHGEDGLGMVTPIWTKPAAETLPPGIGTRLRATYANQSEGFVRDLVSEIESRIPDTTLFALRKLKRLVIVFEGVMGRQYEVSFNKQGTVEEANIRISTQVVGPSEYHQDAETVFEVVRRTIYDLPSEELRSTESTDIVLGFQVDAENGEPVVPPEGQPVFAFLPIERLPQLPFIIHADFVLAANREAIPDTDWNRSLRDGVVAAFQDAIETFCGGEGPISYQWIEYLPRMPIAGFWQSLYNGIKNALSNAEILGSMQFNLKTPSALRILPSVFRYDEKPLFPDNADDIYISDDYDESHLEILRELGLRDITMGEMLTRLKEDVNGNSQSNLRGTYQDDDWHTAFMMFLDSLLQDKNAKSTLWKLPIIPLITSEWVAPQTLSANPVYLPHIIYEESIQVQIPGNLGLRRLHPSACAVSERASVYANLGIGGCNPNTVLKKIFEYSEGPRKEGSIADVVAHLEILFWHGPYQPSFGLPRDVPSQLWGIDDERNWRLTSNLFFRSEKPYDAEKLLERSAVADIGSNGFGFLHSLYMTSQVRQTMRNERTWKQYLEECCSVRSYPTLVWAEAAKISINPTLTLVERNNPDKFVANLREHWQSSYKWENWRSILDRLKKTLIPCRNGTKKHLMATVLPTDSLLTQSRALGVESSMPFIKLPDDQVTGGADSWKFLTEFGVICDTNLEFYLSVLEVLAATHQADPQIERTCSKVYERISRTFKFEDEALLEKAFKAKAGIFVPGPQPAWYTAEKCVWKGPSSLRNTHILCNIYGSNTAVERLFVTLLKMPNATYSDVLKDLSWLRNSYGSLSENDRSWTESLYCSLAKMVVSKSQIESTRKRFESEGLIYAQRWLKPSEVIWNSTSEIQSRVPLERLYPELQAFFVEKLQVTTITVDVLMRELKVASHAAAGNGNKGNAQFIRVKNLMIALGQALTTNSGDEIPMENLQDLRDTAFIPVQEAGKRGQLMRVTQKFFINDHERYGNAFLGKIGMVDFSYADLTSLQALFYLLDVEDCYLSLHVELETVVNSSNENDDLTAHLRRRSYALSCCAIFHHSANYLNHNASVHRRLMNAKVHVSEDMWTNLIIKDQKTDVKVKSDRALAKIEQIENELTLYVPGDVSGLYSCYRTELSSQIASILGIEDGIANKTIYRILNDEGMSLKEIMKDEDIPHCSWIQEPVIPEPVVPEPMVPGAAYVDQQTEDFEHRQSLVGSQQTGNEIFVSSLQATSGQDPSPLAISPPSPTTARLLPLPSTLERVAQDSLYRKVLQNIVKQARKVPRLALPNGFSLAELDHALDVVLDNENGMPLDNVSVRQALGLGIYGNPTFEDNVKIGAAGELFVYERFRALRFPNFGIGNWRSGIRSHVRAHPSYSELQAWTAPEIADIMYEDNSGQMETFLRKISFQSFPQSSTASEWGPGEPIEYLIEVKTTLGPCQTPFFMSMNQYQLMRRHAISDTGGRPRTVYMIARVYNLLSDNIGMEVFVDPWRLKDDVLEFVADPWKVVPPGVRQR